MSDQAEVSSLLQSLPGVFQEDRKGGSPNFLGRFLLAFEKILLGLGDRDAPGLEEVIAGVHRYFEPGFSRSGQAPLNEWEQASEEFLPWLAGWVGIALRESWNENDRQRLERQRELVANAAQLYRLRGTKRGVERFLRIHTRLRVDIEELDTSFRVGMNSTVGKDSIVDGGAPFFFRVRVFVASQSGEKLDLEKLKPLRDIARSIIELQKPAHTYFDLEIVTQTLKVGEWSTVGVDTLVG